jgi:predicted kinase
MKHAELVMLRGLPAAGKSTWSESEVLARPSGDVVRISKDNLRGMLHAGRWVDRTETQVDAAVDALIGVFLADGLTVILDDLNLDPAIEPRLRALAEKYGAVFIIADLMDVPLEVCLQRDEQRDGGVGAAAIHRLWRQHLAQADELR